MALEVHNDGKSVTITPRGITAKTVKPLVVSLDVEPKQAADRFGQFFGVRPERINEIMSGKSPTVKRVNRKKEKPHGKEQNQEEGKQGQSGQARPGRPS